MAESLERRRRTSPRTRSDGAWDGTFYPGEVAELLGVAHLLDYRQLKRLMRVVRGASSSEGDTRSWGSYTIREVASLRILIDVCGADSLGPGRRLRVAKIEEACAALRDAGIAEPLLSVPMHLSGGLVLTLVNGVLVEPTTGQAVIDDLINTASDLLALHVRAEILISELREHAAATAPVSVMRYGIAGVTTSTTSAKSAP